MNHLLAPFIWIDALIQRGVDASAFFLMRRFGLRKALIVYAMSIIFFLSLASLVLLNRSQIPGWLQIAGGLLFFLALIGAYVYYIESIADEENGHILSREDLNQMKHGCYMKCLLFVGIISTIATPSTFEAVGGKYVLLFMLADLARYYLAKTPNTPPAQKKTVLEPAEESA